MKSVRQRQIHNSTYIWNHQNNTIESVYKIETDSQTENKLMVTEGEREGGREGQIRSMRLTDVKY